MPSLVAIRATIIACEACPRLRTYCAAIAREKRRAYRDEVYWAGRYPGSGMHARGCSSSASRLRRTAPTGRPRLHRRWHRWVRRFSDERASPRRFLPTSRRHGMPATASRCRDAFIAAAVRCRPPGHTMPEETRAASAPSKSESRPFRAAVRRGAGKIASSLLQLVGGAAGRFDHVRYSATARVTRCRWRTLFGCYHPSRQEYDTGKLTSR